MAKHLMSFLGTTEYKETDYYRGDISNHKSSKYILDALIDVACRDWNWDTDKISVFLTDKARENNWEKPGALRDILASRKYIKNVTGVDIVAGGSESEIWKMFEQMTEAIGEGDELYIDITNSFRFVPLLMTSVAVFARTVKNAQVKAVYYGAFVPGETRTPILDIIGFMDIIDWSQGTNLFVKSGRIDAISDLSLSVLNANENGDKEIELMMKNLVDMIAGLDNSQGVDLAGRDKDKSKHEVKVTMLEAYKDYQKYKMLFADKYDSDMRMAPIHKVLNVIDEDIEIFNKAAEQNSYFLMGMCAVSWYIRKGKVQQGFTALDETMKTYICQRYKIDLTAYNTRDIYLIREASVQKLCGYLKKSLDKGKSRPEEVRRRKAYEKWINESFGEETYLSWKSEKYQTNNVSEEKKKEQKIVWDLFENGIIEKIIYEMPEDFAKLKFKVGDQRNSMNHFGYTDKKLTEEPLRDLANHFKGFVDIVVRDNMGDSWAERTHIDILSEDILKDLQVLVEDANKFAEI